MRQPARDQLGEAGQSAVALFFNDLGWGPLPTGKHDLGTDLFVQLREDDLTDLGMLLGVQVKTGDSWFNEPAVVDGRKGWWFRDTDHRHEGYWVNHHIPHILVMQDEARNRRVWAQLSRESIESTGVGIRAFVPEDQQLDVASSLIWTELVAASREQTSFEGARWNFDISQVAEAEWPRYALLASRIVAPHPNRGIAADIGWPEAVALCLQANPHGWDEFAEDRAGVPTPGQARESDSPGWRFAAAVYSWFTGSTDELESLETALFPQALRTAHAICLASVLEDRDEWSEAISTLRAVRQSHEASFDQAWVSIQLGWALYEHGDVDEARREFEASLAMHASFASSLTNSAIRSAGILALFDIAPISTGDLAAAVQASDTTLSWWQTQQVENALNQFLRQAFKKWAGDQSITLGGSDSTHNNLVSAEITARLIGNRRSSRYTRYLRALASLSLPAGPHIVASQQLELLRRAGYPSELALAVRHFRSEGPLHVVADYMREVSIRNATTTSIRADLQSLETAGPYVEAPAAAAWISYLLQWLENDAAFMQRFNLDYSMASEVLKAVAGLRLHFDAADVDRVLDYVLEVPEDATPLLERPIYLILKSLELQADSKVVMRITSRALSLDPGSWVRAILLNIVSDVSPSARADVSARLLRGELSAIPAGFTVDSFTTEEAMAVLRACEMMIVGYEDRAAGIAVGGTDPYLLAAQIAVFGHEEVADQAWLIVTTGLLSAKSFQDRKTQSVELLAAHADAIPVKFRDVLLQASKQFEDHPRDEFSTFLGATFAAAGPAFKHLRLELDVPSNAWRSELSRLLAGQPGERCTAIQILGSREGNELVLLALTRDTDRRVSLEAMTALARHAALDSDVANMVVPELLALIAVAGEDAALHLGGGLLRAKSRVREVEQLVAALRAHESLHIRSLAGDLDRDAR